jgi:hypothetical protein
MLVDVNVYGRQVYVDDFENEFIHATQLFYKQESQQFLAHNTVPDYLRRVCVTAQPRERCDKHEPVF